MAAVAAAPQRRDAPKPADADLAPLGDDVLERLREIYDRDVREHVHDRW